MMFENIFSDQILTIISIIVVLIILASLLKSPRKNFPSGPWGLPILGYFPFLPKNAHLHITKLAKKYGDVFSLRLGTEMVLVLNDSASIREAYSKQEMLGKSPNNSFAVYGRKKPFRINDYELWQDHRRFVVRSLKDLSKFEEIIQNEIKDFQEVLKSCNGHPIDFAALLTPSLSNNISNFIFGKKYDYDEPERKVLDKNLDKISKIITKDDILTFFPWFKHVPFLLKWLGFEKNYNVYIESEKIFRKRAEEHKKTLDKKNIRDFIDSYLVEMQQKQEKGCKTSLMDEALFAVVSGIYTASDEAMRSSIRWVMYTLAAFPEEQKKVQEEILQTIGLDRSPDFQDMKSMPFSHAVVLEVMRFNTVTALNVLSYTLADTTVAGYDIPAGTLVLGNFWAVHHDPRYWKDPENFRPERFLTSDGKSVEIPPHYMAFSTGKRMCPGERIAHFEIFLYSVSILQKFDVRFPDGYKPNFEGNFTTSYKPPSVKLRFIPKN